MKQQILNLKKKLLIVELKSDKPVIEHKGELHTMQLIGKLTNITEEQFRQWVDFVPIVVGLPCLTAKEIFFSYLEAHGIYFENELSKPDREEYNFGHGHNEAELYKKHLKVWEEAEQKVWNKDLIYVFQII